MMVGRKREKCANSEQNVALIEWEAEAFPCVTQTDMDTVRVAELSSACERFPRETDKTMASPQLL